LAVLELVKNSWDADARRVSIVVDQGRKTGRIVVMDNGHGMTQEEFEQRWLVIGASLKRSEEISEGGRPLIGEKGLGRLSSFALGRVIYFVSARAGRKGFSAKVNWEDLQAASSLEDYVVEITNARSRRGTRVELQELKAEWNDTHTNFLATHAEFLASVPGQEFKIILRVNGKRFAMDDPVAITSRLAEASIEVTVRKDGTPEVTECAVNDKKLAKIVFRDMKDSEKDSRLAGMRISLKFFRRTEAARRLDSVLLRNEIEHVLERYQGVRFYRDGINVPPYGLNQNDWASLERQRTATGAPTMVPGNSQLMGEVQVSKRLHPHLVITAGRSGFSDQGAVRSVASYVRWAVRELGTARRAERLGISGPGAEIPVRVDEEKPSKSANLEVTARGAIARVAGMPAVRLNEDLRRSVQEASNAVETVLDKNQDMLRLYAQLASMGIAATSFAHELSTEFDVVSDGIDDLHGRRGTVDKELIQTIRNSWKRIREFAALFKVVPIKLRRHSRTMSKSDLEKSVASVLGLAPSERIDRDVVVPRMAVVVVPAELDSILLNLVSNSVKAIYASKNRDKGRLRIHLSSISNDLLIRVADNGCGVTPKVAAVMFEPLEGRFEEGTGMGLPITKYIAERYNGSVASSSVPPEGYRTEMVVRLRGVAREP
jgi:signal transduction histidine kinase